MWCVTNIIEYNEFRAASRNVGHKFNQKIRTAIQIEQVRKLKIHYWVIMKQICEAGIAELKATGTKPQERVLNSLLPEGWDTWMYRVSIYAVLRNKYPIMDQSIKLNLMNR